MAGYIISLSSIESLVDCFHSGTYSTIMSEIKHHQIRGFLWGRSQEGTFADYCSMKEGDYVYFFSNRKIYGIGTLINIGGDCKYLNYPSANEPTNLNYEDIQANLLQDFGEDSPNYRFICVFRPNPFFFRKGVDMDDVLSSNPSKFKMLRVFQQLSFIKLADEENQALLDILLQRNKETLPEPLNEQIFPTNYNVVHNAIAERLNQNDYSINVAPFLSSTARNNSIDHEMAIESALIHQLSTNHEATINIFGRWDYLSHQVVASPFKPISWMDKMDVFGYSYIPNHNPTISKFLIVEIKSGIVSEEDLLQLMKYVDWVKQEYAGGDYSMIEAFLVGFEFSQGCVENFIEKVERNFLYGIRPPIPKLWSNVRLIRYSYNPDTSKIDFTEQDLPVN